jgi:hypothetical protein
METNYFTPITPKKFVCEICDFKCCKNSDWERHLLTAKHKKLTNPNNFKPNYAEKLYTCNCGKVYKHMSSLCSHKKKCNNYEIMIDGINIKDKDALVLLLLKQNGDLQNKIIEIASQSSITNNNNNNSHNITNIDKNFNLNFFLNETCKNAMNITDFVSSIQMNLDDLEHTGRIGYIEGISNIILKNLNKLEQHLRPLHCSDFKREVLYIKDNDEWLKETENKPVLTNAIKTIANENIKQISKWKDNYPDCIKSDSKKNDLYLKIVSNSMSGTSKEECEKNYNKIITNVAKTVIIEK